VRTACVRANDHHEQISKLLRLQDFLRNEAMQSKASDPRLATLRLRQANALTRDIRQAHEKHDMAKDLVRRLIDKLPEETDREMFKLCYLSYLSNETAAGVLGYCARQAYRIKQRAIMHLEGLRY